MDAGGKKETKKMLRDEVREKLSEEEAADTDMFFVVEDILATNVAQEMPPIISLMGMQIVGDVFPISLGFVAHKFLKAALTDPAWARTIVDRVERVEALMMREGKDIECEHSPGEHTTLAMAVAEMLATFPAMVEGVGIDRH